MYLYDVTAFLFFIVTGGFAGFTLRIYAVRIPRKQSMNVLDMMGKTKAGACMH